MQQVRAPTGEIIQFPDSMSIADIEAVMQKEFGSKAKPSTEKPKTPSSRGTFVDPFLQGVSLGAWDEIKSGIRAAAKAPFSEETVGQIYNRELADTRADLAGFRERHPIVAPAVEIGGSVAGLVGSGGATLVPRMGSAAAKVGMTAAEGAGLGGIYGFNSGEGEGRLTGAAVGAGGGALGGAVAGSIAGRMASRAADAATPSTDQLRAASQRLYDMADQAGVVVSDPTYRRIVNNVALEARRAGLDHGVHPKAGAAITRLLDEVGQQHTLREIDTLRRVLRSAAASSEPDERRVASVMIDALDDQIGRLGRQDVLSGNPRVATMALSRARELWSRNRKGEVIQELMDRAGLSAPNFSGSGMENALRTEFRNLAKNAGRMRQFTREEQAAIRRVAMGGPVENTLRMLGKFAPTGVVSSGMSGGIGYAAAGPVGAVALPAAGFAARRAATNMTVANAQRASQMARSGGHPPRVPLTLAQRREVAAALASGLPIGPELQELLMQTGIPVLPSQ